MSLTLNVSYNNVTKKVTTPRSGTVLDLVKSSCSKFGLSLGDLFYNDKLLDASLSIRFTNILNNGKAVLKKKDVSVQDISLKVIAPGGATSMHKISNSAPFPELMANAGIEVSDQLRCSYLNKVFAVSEVSNSKLYEVLGDVHNAVLRFNHFEDNSAEQRKIVEEQLRRQQLRKEKKLQEEKQTRQEVPHPQEASTTIKETENTQINAQIPKEPSQEPPHRAEPLTKAPEPSITKQNTPLVHSEAKGATTEDISSSADTGLKVSASAPSEDVVYQPSDVKIYENPEEDYVFTVEHAKIYQNLIKYKDPRHEHVSKEQDPLFRFRIKFPNNYILEIQLMNTSKFGELIKKIDSHLTEDFRSNYSLKLSYPPFKQFQSSFSLNGTVLKDITEFSNQVMFVFEPKIKGNNYLLNDTVTKKFSDLPEIQLEEHRDALPDDSRKVSVSSDGKKTPKWLKLGK